MTGLSFLADIVLVTTAALLFYAAFTDLKHFIIPNGLVAVVGLMYFAHAALIGDWAGMPGHFGFALVIFIFLLLAYARRWIGGGDVKLLAVAFLWTGVPDAFVFSLLLCVFAILHTLVVRFGPIAVGRVDDSDGKTRIAFAPSIAAALIGVFMLGYALR